MSWWWSHRESGSPQLPDALGLGIALRPAAACLLELACLLEPNDRTQVLLQLWFPDHMRAGQRDVSPRDYDLALSELLGHGLIALTGCETAVVIEPALDLRVRSAVPRPEQEQFARSRAQLWLDRFRADLALQAPQTVHSGIAASVYARRFGAYATAFALLEEHVLLPACRSGEATPVLIHLQLTATESQDRELIERCEARALWLATAHSQEGHLDEALTTFEHGIRFSNRHALGPVSNATWHVQRMEFLRLLGRHFDVLAALDEALALVDRAQAVQECHGLREQAFDNAAAAAKGLGQWERALAHNRRKLESMRARAASPAQLARTKLNDSAGLIELGDFAAADALLRACEEALSGDRDARAQILGERGILASRRGDSDAALRYKRQSLQLYYELRGWRGVAPSHENYANELTSAKSQTREAVAHYLAAALISRLLGDRAAATRVSGRIKQLSAHVAIPRDLQELIQLVERTPKLGFSQCLTQTGKNIPALLGELLQDIGVSATQLG